MDEPEPEAPAATPPTEAELIAHVADLVVGAYYAFRPWEYRKIAQGIRAEILKTTDAASLTAMGQMLRLVEAAANLKDVVGLVLSEQAKEKASTTRQ